MTRTRNLNLTPLLFLAFVLTGFSAQSQHKEKIEIVNSDLFEVKTVNGKEVRKLKGNVIFRQRDVTMSCDSAYFYPDRNAITALGSIHINQADSLNLYGRQLDYDGDRKYAIVKENVSLQDRHMTLTTDRLDYDMDKKEAFYTSGGVITDDENRLTSKIGYFFSETHDMYFRKDVVLVNPKYTIKCDTLQYNVSSRKAIFHGPTYIVSESDTIYCETGWYHTLRNIAQFGSNAYLHSESQYLYGDSLYYDRNRAFGMAKGHIRIIDTAEKLLVEGEYAEHYQKKKKTFITNRVLLTKRFEKDTLYMSGDTLWSEYDKTGKYRILRGYHHAKVFSSQFQAVCDSIIYSFVDSTMDLETDPVFWFGDYQATADNIVVQTRKNKIEKAFLYKNSFIVKPEDSVRFSQVKGRDMIAYFTNNELHTIDVIGNGESIYYVTDDSKAYIGVNKITSSNIRISLADKKVQKINFLNTPDAVLFPMKEISPQESKLDGFVFRGTERPASVESLRASPPVISKTPKPKTKKSSGGGKGKSKKRKQK